MKAKAASKSTNLKFRMIATRSVANCQSGSRLSAAFSSSIVSFAIMTSLAVTLQRIFLFHPVDAAVAGKLAGIETERANSERVAGIERVGAQPVPHFFQFRMTQAGQGDVRREFVGILRLAHAADGRVHLAGEMFQ